MFAKISTHFDCTEEIFWGHIIKPTSLQFVAAPILNFTPQDGNVLDDEWEINKPYQLKLSFFNVIPLGQHQIKLVTIDRDTNLIVSNESGAFAPVWNHTIRFHQTEPDKLYYTDEIEIQAGWRTVFIWTFAHIFYRHRQHRWKKLLAQEIYRKETKVL